MSVKTILVPISAFRAHPKRDNVCPPDVYEKIKCHIQRNQNQEPVIGYRDPDYPDHVTLLNGHVRWQIAQELTLSHLECQIWPITKAEAELTLATLNELKGTPDRAKRAVLLESLTQQFPMDDLLGLLPESQAELHDLLLLNQMDLAAAEEAFWQQLEVEKKVLPIPLSFMVTPEGEAVIMQALAPYLDTVSDRGEALVLLCRKHLEAKFDEVP